MTTIKISHFALANMPGENLGDYLSRLGKELDNFSGVLDATIAQPDENMNENQISGTVYLSGSVAKGKSYEMEQYVAYVTADDNIKALRLAQQKLEDWMNNNPTADIYDITHTFGVNANGEDIIKLCVYYGKK